MDYSYIVAATDRMSTVLAKRMTPTRNDLLGVTTDMCKALTRLLEDQRFWSELQGIAGASPSTQPQRDKFRHDFQEFFDVFLSVEMEALQKAGLSNEAVTRILASTVFARSAANAMLDPKTIRADAERLQKEVCSGATEIEQQKDHSSALRTVRTWGFRFGGIALIVVDVASALPAPWFAVSSAAIGSAIASWKGGGEW